MSPLNNPWSNQAIEKLKALRAKGLSASQIVAELGRDGVGVTRNGVLGKVHRLGLAAPDKPERARKKRLRKPRNDYNIAHPRLQVPAFEAPAVPLSEPVDPAFVAVEPPTSGNPVTLRQLQHHHCRAVIDVGGPLYCGNARGTDWRGLPSSYCPAHHGVFYVAPKRRAVNA